MAFISGGLFPPSSSAANLWFRDFYVAVAGRKREEDCAVISLPILASSMCPFLPCVRIRRKGLGSGEGEGEREREREWLLRPAYVRSNFISFSATRSTFSALCPNPRIIRPLPRFLSPPPPFWEGRVGRKEEGLRRQEINTSGQL